MWKNCPDDLYTSILNMHLGNTVTMGVKATVLTVKELVSVTYNIVNALVFSRFGNRMLYFKFAISIAYIHV